MVASDCDGGTSPALRSGSPARCSPCCHRWTLSFTGAGSGHLAALAAAVIWAVYSVASKLYHDVPSSSVIAASGLTAVGALLIHPMMETTVWPATRTQWFIILAMGLGPVGLAFYLWDHAMKHADVRMLGVASYATPLMSTGLLSLLGLGAGTPLLWLAALLVTAGALLASGDALLMRWRTEE